MEATRAERPAPIHIHLAPFQVQDPGPYATGWKDTIDLGSGDELNSSRLCIAAEAPTSHPGKQTHIAYR